MHEWTRWYKRLTARRSIISHKKWDRKENLMNIWVNN
jgi:hypothetical protein